jgi:nitroreductase
MLMDIYKAIKNRFSCRHFSPRPIEPEKLGRVLEAARLAPSAKNLQDWRFVIVTDPDLRRAVAEAAANQSFVAEAPAVIVGCSVADYVMRCGQPAAAIDLGIAMEHVALAAAAEGLATCWIGAFYPDKLKPLLGIPEKAAVVELMPIGYPDGKEAHTTRERMKNIVCFEKWEFAN